MIKYDKNFNEIKYTTITVCTKCQNITNERCCSVDLVLYQSTHKDFIDSIIPLYKEMNRCSDHLETI